MRVTQTMLSNSTLRHMSNSYQRMGTIQDQLATGKKISRASQDPVVAMNGMRYRSQATEVEQFKRNLGEVYNWMDTADATLDKVTQTMHRIRELTVQAANDSYEHTQRMNIGKEVGQLRDHLIALGNTKSNSKFIFNGTNTTGQPLDGSKMNISIDDTTFLNDLDNDTAAKYEIIHDGVSFFYDSANVFKSKDDREIEISSSGSLITYRDPANSIEKGIDASDIFISNRDAVSTNRESVQIELLKGVKVPVNIDPQNVFSNDFFSDILGLESLLNSGTTSAEDLTNHLSKLDKHIDNIVNERAELGARYNRVEMIDSRVMEQQVIAERILSNNEDADIERVIIDLKSQENIHRAALATGARIIQPSLMDFLR